MDACWHVADLTHAELVELAIFDFWSAHVGRCKVAKVARMGSPTQSSTVDPEPRNASPSER
eukprot:14568645-Alexandrium_andersonii.AAC.1